MSVAMRYDPRMRVADFIDLIRSYPDEQRWELLDGDPVLMAPQSERHQSIVANLLQALSGPAKARQCRALPGLGILSDQNDHYAPIPDVVVRCGPLARDGYARDPIFVAEVLSPSTMDHDRGSKVRFYKSVPSLRTILLIYQEEDRIEVWRRDATEAWVFARLSLGDVLELNDLALSLRVADVYDGIAL